MADGIRFDGRAVVVTGAGRGIGRAHALYLASLGAQVVVADLGSELDGSGSSTAPADEVVAEIEARGGTAIAAYGNVADEADAAAIVGAAVERFGRIDALVNNAGRNSRIPFAEMPLDEYRRMLDVHFWGALFTIRAAWPHFVETGYGRIVNTVSEALFAGENMTHYASAKGAVLGLSRGLAAEGEDVGILVNLVAPRALTRSSEANVFSGYPTDVLDKIRRVSAPEMNSPVVAYLAHESCAVTGELFQTGGPTMARMAVVRSQTLGLAEFRPEEVAEGLDGLLDLADATLIDHHLPAAKSPAS
ncbi:MAG TPA: SDR family NAD(P)-dependent oxidoreductase [Acidimicrobiales bacterium]